MKDQNAAAKQEKKVDEMAAPLPTKKQSDTMAKIKQRIVTKKIKRVGFIASLAAKGLLRLNLLPICG